MPSINTHLGLLAREVISNLQLLLDFSCLLLPGLHSLHPTCILWIPMCLQAKKIFLLCFILSCWDLPSTLQAHIKKGVLFVFIFCNSNLFWGISTKFFLITKLNIVYYSLVLSYLWINFNCLFCFISFYSILIQ